MEQKYAELINLVKMAQNHTQLSLLRISEKVCYDHYCHFTQEVNNLQSLFLGAVMTKESELREQSLNM